MCIRDRLGSVWFSYSVHVLFFLFLKVILNVDVSKRVKSAFFNHFVLKQTAQLLFIESSDPGSSNNEVSSCRQLAFEFLVSLCTDFQCGICYKNKAPPAGLERRVIPDHNLMYYAYIHIYVCINQSACSSRYIFEFGVPKVMMLLLGQKLITL